MTDASSQEVVQRIRVGRHVRYRVEDLNSWLNERSPEEAAMSDSTCWPPPSEPAIVARRFTDTWKLGGIVPIRRSRDTFWRRPDLDEWWIQQRCKGSS